MAYVYSLNVAADFGDMIGESATANQYRQLAETIKVGCLICQMAELYKGQGTPTEG
jgi:hypothetical protein